MKAGLSFWKHPRQLPAQPAESKGRRGWLDGSAEGPAMPGGALTTDGRGLPLSGSLREARPPRKRAELHPVLPGEPPWLCAAGPVAGTPQQELQVSAPLTPQPPGQPGMSSRPDTMADTMAFPCRPWGAQPGSAALSHAAPPSPLPSPCGIPSSELRVASGTARHGCPLDRLQHSPGAGSPAGQAPRSEPRCSFRSSQTVASSPKREQL